MDTRIMDELTARVARGLWTLYEPVHAVTYFAPQAVEEFADAGLRGFWRGYFAGRAAPLGAVGAAPVTALFGSFAPAMVERALPSVWDLVTPDEALRARAAGAAAAIRSCVGDADAQALLELLEPVVRQLPTAGRPLAAANVAAPPPEDPVERLWQATSILREWRGDAHIAAQVAHGVAGLDILVLRCLIDIERPAMQRARGWTDDEWSTATIGLTDRGLVDGGRVTDEGHRLINSIEDATDRASAPAPVDEARAIGRLLRPFALACSTLLPFPNPIGLVGAWDPDTDPDAELVARP